MFSFVFGFVFLTPQRLKERLGNDVQSVLETSMDRVSQLLTLPKHPCSEYFSSKFQTKL